MKGSGSIPPRPMPASQPPSPTNEDACTELPAEHEFNYNLHECPKGQKVQLLNSGGVAIYGTITNIELARQMGIIGWYPVPKRNKVIEANLGVIPHAKSPRKE